METISGERRGFFLPPPSKLFSSHAVIGQENMVPNQEFFLQSALLFGYETTKQDLKL